MAMEVGSVDGWKYGSRLDCERTENLTCLLCPHENVISVLVSKEEESRLYLKNDC